MHKFLRAAGFSMYQKKKDIDALLRCLSKDAGSSNCVQIDRSTSLHELRYEAAPGIGIAMFGELNEKEELDVEYYYPYLISETESSDAECSIQRHAEKETYAGLLDEYKVGISLIFYLLNSMEYRTHSQKKKTAEIASVNLSAFSVHGKVLLPIKKSAKQIEKEKVASRNRDNLLEAAKNGDEDAMESLTIEDIDLYSQASRRALQEDIYSIVETSFMPSGVECDQYSIVAEIIGINVTKNRITGEEIYNLKLDCNDLQFALAINKLDLQGEPKVGRRFKGRIWMQGVANFKEIQTVT